MVNNSDLECDENCYEAVSITKKKRLLLTEVIYGITMVINGGRW
jgi:hypothetical protein